MLDVIRADAVTTCGLRHHAALRPRVAGLYRADGVPQDSQRARCPFTGYLQVTCVDLVPHGAR